MQLPGLAITQLQPQALELCMQSERMPLSAVLSQLEARGIMVKGISGKSSMLEQAFVKLVDKKTAERLQ